MTLASTTRIVRAGIATDREHGAVVPPIHLTSTFAFEGFGRPRTFDYTRSGNPTRSQLADALADLEGGASAVVTSTGMSAVTLVANLVKAGELIVAAHDCYGGTQRLLKALAGRGHFDVVFADLTADASLALIASRKPRIVWIETPSNPLLRITDVRRVAECAHAAGAIVVVDNTFLSPALQQPIALGADLVVHSTTKYLNGHSDVVGGAVIAKDRALGDDLAWWANCLGITGAPFDSYLTLRGARTLHARMRTHLENAGEIVNVLSSHSAVGRVYYPGLATHPGHDIATRQQSGYGAMVSFELRGGAATVERFVSELRLFTLAESLGGVESLVAHPATMTHASMDAAAREGAGIRDSLVRLSIGIEHADDLARDVAHALDRVEPRHIASTRSRVSGVCNGAWTPEPADVVVVGAGAIGRELVGQLNARCATAWPAVRIVALADTSGYLLAPDGLTHAALADACTRKAARTPVAAIDGACTGAVALAVDAIARTRRTRTVLVDATASDTTPLLELALARGFDLVLANKVPLAGPQHRVDQLHDSARRAGRSILHEATVGAGLPVIDTLRKLIDAGDTVLSIEGCPSGTLGFLFGEIGRGVPFSVALRSAIALGYTEPDPRIDLSGVDVARKALILARMIGFRGELADARVESLVPQRLRDVSLETLLDRLSESDAHWAARVTESRERATVLRYRALVTPDSIRVGLVAVDAHGALGALSGTDNQFTFTTARYREQPLVITGPGAGPTVTAAGVLNDILQVANARRA